MTLSLAACDSDDEDDGVSRSGCGHEVAYHGDLDGYTAAIRVVDNTNYDRYTVDVYVALPDGGGVSKGTVEMRQCGEIYTTANGSAGMYEIVGLLTADSASGTWSNDELGRSGDWIAEVERR